MRGSIVQRFLVMSAIVGAPLTAFADQTSEAPQETARRLYDEALREMAQKGYASACPKIEEVIRLVPEGIGAKITLGECYEESGRLGSAFAAFKRAEQAATKANQAERANKARQRAGALQPRCARITVVVPVSLRELPGLSVEKDGVLVPQEEWGVAVPADRGEHTVVVTARGRERLDKRLEIKRDGEVLLVEVEEPKPKRAAAVSSRASTGSGVGPIKPVPQNDEVTALLEMPPDDSPNRRASFWGAQRYAAVAVGAGGLAALGVGLGFGVKALQARDESLEAKNCDPGVYCTADGLKLRQEGMAAGNISTALVLPGIAAMAGAAILFFTAPKADTEASRFSFGAQGLSVRLDD